MKAKTVWKMYDPEVLNEFWDSVATPGVSYFAYHADVRWVNVWGKILQNVELDERGKILGDSDES